MKKFALNNLKITSASLSKLNGIFKEMLLSEKSNLILTYNIDFLKNAEKYKEFKEISQKADLILPDGIGITSLLKIKYNEKVERITGSILFLILLKIADQEKLKISLIGSTHDVINKLTKKIIRAFPAISIVSAISPPFEFEKNEKLNRQIINEIKSSSPDILFAAFGNPRQEIWLYKNMKDIDAKINVGVGAVFDFYSGAKKRAPESFQKIGMEWLWRLISEPKRLFRRYIIDDIPFYIKMRWELFLNKSSH